MKRFFSLILFSCFFIILSACTTVDPIKEPPKNLGNRLSTSDFATAKALFESNCQGCHVSAPVGPPFKGHLPKFTKVANGQSYLINALLFGVAGPITANGQDFNSVMASRANDFSDSEVALLLNYGLTGLDNDTLLPEDFKLITSEDVAKERQIQKTATEVLALRNVLELP